MTCGDVAGLEYLGAVKRDISDLTGLEYATNLQSLDLSGNRISDISALEGLTKLQFLFLRINRISDVSALKGLTNLRDLSLRSNQISDISPLVANPGIGDGDDSIQLYSNCLVSPQAQQDIAALEDRNPNQQNINADLQGGSQCLI